MPSEHVSILRNEPLSIVNSLPSHITCLRVTVSSTSWNTLRQESSQTGSPWCSLLCMCALRCFLRLDNALSACAHCVTPAPRDARQPAARVDGVGPHSTARDIPASLAGCPPSAVRLFLTSPAAFQSSSWDCSPGHPVHLVVSAPARSATHERGGRRHRLPGWGTGGECGLPGAKSHPPPPPHPTPPPPGGRVCSPPRAWVEMGGAHA